MYVARSLLLVLALGGASIPLAVTTDAHAQQAAVFAAPGLVDFLPAGEVVGDGATTVTLHVLALKPDGTPMTNLKPRLMATEGEVTGWTEVGGGLYSAAFTPPKVEQAKSVSIKLRGKNDAKENVEVDYNVTVRPPMSKRLTVTANPPQLVLGQDTEATLSFTLEGPAGQPLHGADLVIHASSGEVTNVTDMGGGRFTARFVPPRVNFPQLVLLTVADRRDPSRTYGHAVIPLNGKTDYPVKSQPNGSVILRIAGRDFGPVNTNAEGRAAVPVVVPPGIDKATLVSVVNGASKEESIDLRVPETKRLKLLPLHPGAPADGSLKLPVRVVVRAPTGAPDTGAKVQFASQGGGTFGEVRHEGEGVYVAEFTPPTGNAQQPVTITASLVGSATQVDSATLTLVPVRPESVALTSEPSTLGQDTSAFKVFAKIVGPGGAGLAQRQLVFSAAGAKLKGEVADLRNGDYRADFTTSGSGPVELIATVQTPSTGNPLRRVIVFPAREVVPNDGVSSAMLTVLSVDEFGYPVPNVAVQLRVEGADGSLPAQATTNANGIAQVFYTAGRTPDLARIVVTAGDHEGGTALLQVPSAVRPVDLPISGTAANRALDARWAAIVTALRIERDGALGAAAGIPQAAASGVVAKMSVAPDPAVAAPGGTVILRVKAVDDEGRGVSGQQLELITSQGRFGTVTDLGGGAYEVPLVLPAEATGEAKVSIAAGDASSFVKVPISAAAAATMAGGSWSTTGATGPTSTTATATSAPVAATPPPAPPPTKAPKPPREAGNHPTWRARAGFVASSYSYDQRPFVADGPLLPVELQIGGDGGGPPATPMGGELNVRGFPIDYLGVDVGVRATFYSITASVFQGAAAPDSLIDAHALAIGRYPFDVNGNRFHAGVRAGFTYGDFILFKGCVEQGCTVEYQTLALPGFEIGAEIGAEVGKMYGVAGIGESLYFATPYATAVDFGLGYHLSSDLFVELGFEGAYRNILVVGQDTETEYGQLSDGQNMGKLSIGYAF